MAKQLNHDQIAQAAREEHGVIITRQLSSGHFLVFRLPTEEEIDEFYVDNDDRGIDPRQRQLAYQTLVHPKGKDPKNPGEELKKILDKKPGLPHAIATKLLTLVGQGVEFVPFDDLMLEERQQAEPLKAKGAEFFGVCPDGEMVGAKPPLPVHWRDFQDSKDPKNDRYKALGRASFVGDESLLKKYPRLAPGPLADAAIEAAGAAEEFEAKKG
ncbi:MAG: hypothetical protein R3337_00430 [Gammaproteobacteria bacterium]|nr:hypothetical protein [Gammaproteobacteria bacterium]